MWTFSELDLKVFPVSDAIEMQFSLSVACGSSCSFSSSQMTCDDGNPETPGIGLRQSLKVLAHLSNLSSFANESGLCVVSLSDASAGNRL